MVKDSIYKGDFNYNSEERINNCGFFVPKSKCPAVKTSRTAPHLLFALSGCLQCRRTIAAFCVNTLKQDPTGKQVSEIIRAGAEFVTKHPGYRQSIAALQETVAKIYNYKVQNAEVANEKGM